MGASSFIRFLLLFLQGRLRKAVSAGSLEKESAMDKAYMEVLGPLQLYGTQVPL